MKLSELIPKLQKLQAEHGDLPIIAHTLGTGISMDICDVSKSARQSYDDFTLPIGQRTLKKEHVIALDIDD